MIQLLNCSSILLLCLMQSLCAYGMPDPIIKVFKKGFRVSIPHAWNIQRFTFNAKINSQFEQLENGTFSGDIYGPDGNNQWTYENPNAELQLGDILYYWFTVRESNKDSVKRNLFYSITTYEYKIPTPTITIYSKGFEVSIPHEEGIE
ncbi:Beta-1,3-glucan-binding protein [Eumeta japonica]|uniref:Beta-1,3-glucan-binding protein n=1 Tax=Eumeta variegata TaxID=151549 RepID=A0A4C1T1V4_EUMVA|nr:Beta-1,3-glucan-binding protein [Eumeta japonica]